MAFLIPSLEFTEALGSVGFFFFLFYIYKNFSQYFFGSIFYAILFLSLSDIPVTFLLVSLTLCQRLLRFYSSIWEVSLDHSY